MDEHTQELGVLEGLDVPTNIVSGIGVSTKLSNFHKSIGRVLLITTERFVETDDLNRIQRQYSLVVPSSPMIVHPNPDLETISDQIGEIEEQCPELLVAVGGGSVIDYAKAVGGLMGAPPGVTLRRILEDKLPVPESEVALPLIAIPTTAGTGSEVTQFATIWDKKRAKKFSLEAESLRPTWSILDPVLTLSMSQDLSLFSALDTISHGIESLWNKNRSAKTISYSEKSLVLGISALDRVIEDQRDIEARAQMQIASTFGGLAISSTRTAIAHSISYPLTAHFGIPHGLACSFTLPAIWDSFYSKRNQTSWLPAIVEEAIEMTRGYDLHRRVLEFASKDEILSKVSEMYLPGRADNFPFVINLMDLSEIIDSALTV